MQRVLRSRVDDRHGAGCQNSDDGHNNDWNHDQHHFQAVVTMKLLRFGGALVFAELVDGVKQCVTDPGKNQDRHNDDCDAHPPDVAVVRRVQVTHIEGLGLLGQGGAAEKQGRHRKQAAERLAGQGVQLHSLVWTVCAVWNLYSPENEHSKFFWLELLASQVFPRRSDVHSLTASGRTRMGTKSRLGGLGRVAVSLRGTAYKA